MRDFKVFGYACVSQHADGPSAEVQAVQVEKWAAEIDAEFVGCRTESSNGPEDRLTGRPEWRALLETLRRGNHLVVAKLTTITTNPRALTTAIQDLATRGVHLHTITESGSQLDLNPAGLEALARSWRMYEEAFASHVSMRTRASLRNKKANGEAYCSHPPIGKKRVVQKFGGKILRFDAWDTAQCDLIREIHRRKTDGETYESIAANFLARKLKKSNGQPWVPIRKRSKKLNTSSLRRAHDYYVSARARGLEIGIDDV
jgi:DNA invertase Pin-like site-specific DNA recombinase